MRVMRNILIIIVIIAGSLTAGLYGLTQLIDPAKVKARVEAEVLKATSRQLMIAGDVTPQIGFAPVVTIHDVSLGNPKWAKNKHLFSAKQMMVKLKLLPLLQGKIRFAEVMVSDASITMERSAKGTRSWILSKADPEFDLGQKATKAPAAIAAAAAAKVQFHIEHLVLQNSTIDYISLKTGSKNTIKVSSLEIRHLNPQGVENFVLGGNYRKQAMQLSGAIADDNLLMIAGSIEGTGVALRLDGSLDLKDMAFDANVEAKADKASQLVAALGGKSNLSMPIELTAKLGGTPEVMTLANVTASSSNWKGEGTGTLNLTGKVPYLDAKIAVPNLVVKAEQSATAEEKKETPQTFDLAWMKTMNATLTIAIKSADYKGIALKNVRTGLALQDGKLDVSGLSMTLAEGEVKAKGILDSSISPTRYQLEWLMDGVLLEQLWPILTSERKVKEGPIHAALKLSGAGDNSKAMLASTSGTANIVAEKIRYDVSDTVSEAVSFVELLRGSKDEEGWLGVQCAVGQFDIATGKANAKVLAFKTAGAIANGTGSIMLPDQTLDIVMRARSGSIGLADMVPALHFTGPISDPSIQPDAGSMLLGIGKLVLGATTGVGLVAVLGEQAADSLGITSDNNPCLTALNKKAAESAANPPDPAQAVKHDYDSVEKEIRNVRDGAKKNLKQLKESVKGVLP